VIKPDARLKIAIDGYCLTGTKRGRRWRFRCAAWPALATENTGLESADAIITEFVRRAMAHEPRAADG
jgi:hypothetical protein